LGLCPQGGLPRFGLRPAENLFPLGFRVFYFRNCFLCQTNTSGLQNKNPVNFSRDCDIIVERCAMRKRAPPKTREVFEGALSKF
jgi:hypothetical protein